MGLFFDLSASRASNHPKPKSSYRANKDRSVAEAVSSSPAGLGEELKMVILGEDFDARGIFRIRCVPVSYNLTRILFLTSLIDTP